MNCVICLEDEVTHAFIPCGHLACCTQCYTNLADSGRNRCPVCRQTIVGTFRVYLVTEEERRQITDSRINDLKELSSKVEEATQILSREQQAVQDLHMRIAREKELVRADRDRKKALLHMDLTSTLKEPTKAQSKALKKNTAIRGLPEVLRHLITTVDQTGGYYQQCEESDLRLGDQAVVIARPSSYQSPVVAQGVVAERHGIRSVGNTYYSYWNFPGNPVTFLKYVH